MNDLGRIFGKAICPLIEQACGVAVFNVDPDRLKCDILVGGDEYWLVRDSARQWRVGKEGYMWICHTQWELLEWIEDRL